MMATDDEGSTVAVPASAGEGVVARETKESWNAYDRILL